MKDKKTILLLSLLTAGLLLTNITLAFTGPGAGQNPGSGGGLLFSSSTNIGIGTNNPGSTLEVYGANGNTLKLSGAQSPSLLFYPNNSLRDWAITTHYNNNYNTLEFWASNSDNGNPLTAGSSKLTIQAGGNVGIGSSTPGYPLTVNGNVYSTGNFIGGLSGALSAANVTGPTVFGSNIQTTPPVGYVYAFPQALAVGTTTVVGLPTNGLLVTGTTTLAVSAGNVGIGTAGPTRTLSLKGIQGWVSPNDTEVAYMNPTNTGTDFALKNSGGGLDIRFDGRTNGNSYFNNGGSVGIGTTTPSAPLTILSNSSVGWIDLKTTSGNEYINGVNGFGLYAGNKANQFVYGGSGSASLGNVSSTSGFGILNVINSTGNIGIATTTPQYDLSVVGSYYSVEVDKGNSGTTTTIDWSAGNTQHVILTSGPATPVALTFTNPQPGARYTLIFKQDGTGGRTVTWPASFRTGSAGPITLSTAPNATDYVGLQYNGVDGKYDNVAFNAGF